MQLAILMLKNKELSNHLFFFNIRTENRDYVVKAETKQNKDEWVKIIKEHCQKGEITMEARQYLKKKDSFVGIVNEK